jgi:putative FmdB family regulatory protein
MPWYDYQCEKCGTVFEINRSMTAAGKAKCTACGSTRTIRIYAAAPIVFKGAGFYATDSGSRGSTTSSSTDSAPPVETTAPKSETKKPAKQERKSA